MKQNLLAMENLYPYGMDSSTIYIYIHTYTHTIWYIYIYRSIHISQPILAGYIYIYIYISCIQDGYWLLISLCFMNRDISSTSSIGVCMYASLTRKDTRSKLIMCIAWLSKESRQTSYFDQTDTTIKSTLRQIRKPLVQF